MTVQTNEDEQTAARYTKPYRHIVSYALLAVASLDLLVILVHWLMPPTSGTLADRATDLFSVVGLVTVGLPLVAVLIATHVTPVIPQAKLVTLATLVLYGLTSLLLLVGTVTRLLDVVESIEAKQLLVFLLNMSGNFALLGVPFFVVLRVFLGLTPKAAPTPAYGGYGQQQYSGQPYPQAQAYPQPATAAAPAAQSAAAAATASAAQAAYGQQAYGAQQQAYGQQYGYGQQQAQQQQAAAAGYQAQQQQAAPSGGQMPAYGAQAAAPTSAAPASGAPASSPPSSSPPASYGAEQQQQQQPAQAGGWPPAPSTAQWPPTPSAKPAAAPSSGEEVQHTQLLKPEQYRGNSS